VRLKDELQACLKAGGYLAVSGIFQDNYRGFRKAFKSDGMRCIRTMQQRKWYACLFRKIH